MTEKIVVVYKTPGNKEPFSDWLFSLRDKIMRHRIETRIDRIRQGNYGDHKRFHGIIELRLDFGKGYRLYCGEDADMLVVLLIGGDKSSQYKDIKKALDYWRDYHEQKKI
ncbi:MAG: type II toxin-antitoxin system RelE/ParE family toxin [Candidatus Omnitrophica bacterium]|nr:type II toxin-antitoxin system RelE/ParE family toxin [Candidatus Omnitrophota bacterium]